MSGLYFEFEKGLGIDDFDYDTACSIFGKGVVDDHLNEKNDHLAVPHGMVVVATIDRKRKDLK